MGSSPRIPAQLKPAVNHKQLRSHQTREKNGVLRLLRHTGVPLLLSLVSSGRIQPRPETGSNLPGAGYSKSARTGWPPGWGAPPDHLAGDGNQTDWFDAKSLTQLVAYPGCKLRTSVRNNVLREPVVAEDVGKKLVGCFHSSGKLGQWKETWRNGRLRIIWGCYLVSEVSL